MSNTVIPNDPWGALNKDVSERIPSSKEVSQAHINSDRDSSVNALHHTLGTRRNQAAKGDHVHDGENGKLVGEGLHQILSGFKNDIAPFGTMTITQIETTLSNIVNVLSNVIDFTDTRAEV